MKARPQREWRSAEGISADVLSKLRRLNVVDALQHLADNLAIVRCPEHHINGVVFWALVDLSSLCFQRYGR